MSLATELQDNIAEVIDDPDIGVDLVLRRQTAGTYNPATGAVDGADDTDLDGRGLVLGYRDRDIDGKNIIAGDRKVILRVKGLGVVPAPGDTILLGVTVATLPGGDPVSVVALKRVSLGGTDVHFACQVREHGAG